MKGIRIIPYLLREYGTMQIKAIAKRTNGLPVAGKVLDAAALSLLFASSLTVIVVLSKLLGTSSALSALTDANINFSPGSVAKNVKIISS